MPIVNCRATEGQSPSRSVPRLIDCTTTRTYPLFAWLERPGGDRAQALHPHDALASDVVHKEALARDYTVLSATPSYLEGTQGLTQRLPKTLALRRTGYTHRTRQERIPANAPVLRSIKVDGHNITPDLRREQNLPRTGEDRLRHLHAQGT